MANEITMAGASLKYCVETTAGTKPTSGYTAIPNVKSIPEINPEPSNLECTDLSDTIWKRYTQGLRDPGSAIGFTCNFTSAFKTAWDAAVSAAQTAAASNKATWWEITIPGNNSFYFAGMPSALGYGGAEVDTVAEVTAYVTPNQIAGFAAASS